MTKLIILSLFVGWLTTACNEQESLRWRSAKAVETEEMLLRLEVVLELDSEDDAQVISSRLIPGTALTATSQDDDYTVEVLTEKNASVGKATFRKPKVSECTLPKNDGDNSTQENLRKNSSPKQSIVVTFPYLQQPASIRINEAKSGKQIDLKMPKALLDKKVTRSENITLTRSTGTLNMVESPDYVDIVLVGEGFGTNSSAFTANADSFISQIANWEPFKSRIAKLRFHRLLAANSLSCSYNGRLITCDRAKIIQEVNNANIAYDKILVIKNSSTYGGSAELNGEVAISYNGSEFFKVAIHELAHTFNVLDEYTLYGSNGDVVGVDRNCFSGVPPATAWSGKAQTYALGCNYPNWYRSSASSIMYALDALYFNAISQEIIDATITKLSLPTVPNLYSVYANSSTTMNLYWVDAQNETEYLIERSNSPSDSWQQIGTANQNAVAYTDVGLSPDTTYYYRLRAKNLNGASGYSSVLNAKTKSGPVTCDWQNPASKYDVNNDHSIAPNDVLAIINDLNRNGARTLTGAPEKYFYDVNCDNSIGPTDVLTVINCINSPSCSSNY